MQISKFCLAAISFERNYWGAVEQDADLLHRVLFNEIILQLFVVNMLVLGKQLNILE